ncbi:hypothetical protein DOY81_009203 [Sarcophaga bullata]|nr:hypothetical protein DOY81_009203 [Sarcophaga bullata]
MENEKLEKILKDSHREADNENNNKAEVKDQEQVNDYEEDDGGEDIDDDEDDDDNDDNTEDDYNDEDYEKKAEISKKIVDHGIRVEEIDLSKETNDRFLLDKFIAERKKHLERVDEDEDENEDDNDEEEDDNDEEYIIERGHIYYSGYRFLVPIIIILTCVIVLLLVIVKIVSMVMRKRGERYRMSLLQAHTNSIVYQKLTEDIKPPKESKQPKVHRYAPINQV